METTSAAADLNDFRAKVHRLLEEDVRLAEQVAARDSFLALAAHKLRNPMTSIISRIALMRSAVAKGNVPLEKLAHPLEQIGRPPCLTCYG